MLCSLHRLFYLDLQYRSVRYLFLHHFHHQQHPPLQNELLELRMGQQQYLVYFQHRFRMDSVEFHLGHQLVRIHDH